MRKYLLSLFTIILIGVLTFLYVDNQQPVTSLAQGAYTDFYFNVGAGRAPNTSTVLKFGRNSDVDTGSIEDIWDGGGTWSAPTVSQLHTITSTQAADTAAGTGARTVQVYGLDSTGAEINETVTLAGATTVTTTNQYSMIHRMIVRTAGSGGENAGVIAASGVTDLTITAQINAGNNQTLMSIYKVPLAKRLCMTAFYADMNRSVTTGAANTYLYAKPDGEVFQIKQLNGIVGGGTSHFQHFYQPVNCFDPLTIIKIAADASANNTDVSAGFDGVLVPQ